MPLHQRAHARSLACQRRRRCPPSPRGCRVQDAPAARLYEKAQFEEVAADSFLVRLLGWDQRRLMRKRLPPSSAQSGGAAS